MRIKFKLSNGREVDILESEVDRFRTEFPDAVEIGPVNENGGEEGQPPVSGENTPVSDEDIPEDVQFNDDPDQRIKFKLGNGREVDILESEADRFLTEFPDAVEVDERSFFEKAKQIGGEVLDGASNFIIELEADLIGDFTNRNLDQGFLGVRSEEEEAEVKRQKQDRINSQRRAFGLEVEEESEVDRRQRILEEDIEFSDEQKARARIFPETLGIRSFVEGTQRSLDALPGTTEGLIRNLASDSLEDFILNPFGVLGGLNGASERLLEKRKSKEDRRKQKREDLKTFAAENILPEVELEDLFEEAKREQGQLRVLDDTVLRLSLIHI